MIRIGRQRSRLLSLAANIVMPKESARRSARSKAQRQSPSAHLPASNKTGVKSAPKQHYNTADPKASHLYTDNNPATTLHGTGFKDAATAEKTLELVSARSLTYQFQTVNTMFHRARNHPHSKGNKDIEAAMGVFRTWLDDTYPAAKAQRKDFKPVLKKDTVRKYIERISEDTGVDASFAKMYVDLPKGKRLANVLVDEQHPEQPDWARAREMKLQELAAEKGEKPDDGELWEEDETPSTWHLSCIAWAWSPVSERKL